MDKIIYFIGSVAIAMFIASFLKSIWRHISLSRQDDKLYRDTQKEFEKLTPEQRAEVEKSIKI